LAAFNSLLHRTDLTVVSHDLYHVIQAGAVRARVPGWCQ